MAREVPVHVHTTDSPAEFLEEVGPWLQARLDDSYQILNISTGARDTPGYCDEAWLAIVREGGETVLAAVRTPPRAVVFGGGDPAAVPPVIAALRGATDVLPGVVGPRRTAVAFAEAWAPGAWTEHMAIRMYRLYDVLPDPRRPAGLLRVATPADAPLFAEWIEGFLTDADVRDPRSSVEIAEMTISEGRGRFFEVDGRPVAAVAGGERVPGTAHVGMVYTPRDLRGLGYGSAATAALVEELLGAGPSSCVLFADLANPTSNSIYQRIGFRAVSDSVHLTFPESP